MALPAELASFPSTLFIADDAPTSSIPPNPFQSLPPEILDTIFEFVIADDGYSSGHPLSRHLLPYTRQCRYAYLYVERRIMQELLFVSFDAARESFAPFDLAGIIKVLIINDVPLCCSGIMRECLDLMRNVREVRIVENDDVFESFIRPASTESFALPSVASIKLLRVAVPPAFLTDYLARSLEQYPRLRELVVDTRDTAYGLDGDESSWPFMDDGITLQESFFDTSDTLQRPNTTLQRLSISMPIAQGTSIPGRTHFLHGLANLRSLSVFDMTPPRNTDWNILFANLACHNTLEELILGGTWSPYPLKDGSESRHYRIRDNELKTDAGFTNLIRHCNDHLRRLKHLTLSGFDYPKLQFEDFDKDHALETLTIEEAEPAGIPFSQLSLFLLSSNRPRHLSFVHINTALESRIGTTPLEASFEPERNDWKLPGFPEYRDDIEDELLGYDVVGAQDLSDAALEADIELTEDVRSATQCWREYLWAIEAFEQGRVKKDREEWLDKVGGLALVADQATLSNLGLREAQTDPQDT